MVQWQVHLGLGRQQSGPHQPSAKCSDLLFHLHGEWGGFFTSQRHETLLPTPSNAVHTNIHTWIFMWKPTAYMEPLQMFSIFLNSSAYQIFVNYSVGNNLTAVSSALTRPYVSQIKFLHLSLLFSDDICHISAIPFYISLSNSLKI